MAAKVLEVIGLMVPLAFVYLYWRTGSAHAFRHRIWRMLYGDTKVSDPCIAGYLQERTDLMALRQECGLRIRTVAQGQKVIQWLRTHDESSDDLRASREFFDLENLRFTVDDPKSLNVRRYAMGLIALTIAVLLCALAAVSDRVYFKITKTDTWFSSSLREEGVRDVVLSPLDDNTRITKAQCSGQPSALPVGSFRAEDMRVLCGFVNRQAEEMKTALHEQRLAAGMLTGEALFGWLFLFYPYLGRRRASDMLTRVLSRPAPSPEPTPEP